MAEQPPRALLPDGLELDRLGIAPEQLQRVELLREKHDNAVYRLTTDRGSFVLKWFSDPTPAEISAYQLLTAYGVPTLPVHGHTERSLLLEDLATSGAWRLATAEDAEEGEVGMAIAEWYLALHRAGRELLTGPAPDFLKREMDELSADRIVMTGGRLGLSDSPVWQLAAEHIEQLKQAFRALGETLNYNDFHWTNLALSRDRPPRAIVFDYHLLGIGPAYCDCRNVCGSLGDRAQRGFRDAYGPVGENAAVLDAPLAKLYALYVAAQFPELPVWSLGCVEAAASGELEKDLVQALQMVR